MTSKTLLPRTAKLVLATIVATGMAAAPVAVSTGFRIVTADAYADTAGATAPAGTAAANRHANPQKTIGTMANAKVPAAEGGDIGGYAPGASGNLVALTKTPIDNMVNLTLNDGLATPPAVSGQQVAKAIDDEQAMAKAPVPGMTLNHHHSEDLRRYARAMNAGDLDAAATALAQSTNDVIDKTLVVRMNRDLGVTSTLNAQQVAQVAAAKQAVRFAEAAPVLG